MAHGDAWREREHELPPTGERSRAKWAFVIATGAVASAAALVIAVELVVAFGQGSANSPWAGGVVILLVAAIFLAAYSSLDAAELLGVPMVAVIIAMGFGYTVGLTDRSGGRLRDYCEYGAVSKAQLNGCLDHVTDAQINRLDTNAARFAVGGLDACLEDSGPYCANRVTARHAQDDATGQ